MAKRQIPEHVAPYIQQGLFAIYDEQAKARYAGTLCVTPRRMIASGDGRTWLVGVEDAETLIANGYKEVF